MRWNVLWWFLPDEALPLVSVGCGLLVILGVMRSRAALGIIGTFVVLILLSPFLDGLFDALPAWLLLLVGLAVVMSIVRGLTVMVLGQRAADHMAGALAADAARGLVRLVFLPIRVAFALLTGPGR
jgi:hypothetical protein